MTLELALVQSQRTASTPFARPKRSARKKHTQLTDELVGGGIMSARDLTAFVAGRYQTPLLDLTQYKLDTVPVMLSANRHLTQLRLSPLGRRGNHLILTTSDPSDPRPIEELRQRINMIVETVIIKYDKLVHQLSLANRTPVEIKSLFPKQEVTQIEYNAGAATATRRIAPGDVDDALVMRFLQKLSAETLLRGTSDLHFEPFEASYHVRSRINDILTQVAQPLLDIRDGVATHIKVLSRLGISERHIS